MKIKELYKTIQSFVDEHDVTKLDILLNKGNQVTMITEANKKI